MGNTVTNKKDTNCLWNNEEKIIVEKSYQLVSHNTNVNGNVHRDQLNAYFRKIVGDVFAEYLIRFLYNASFKRKQENYIEFKRYVDPFIIFEKMERTAQVDLIMQCMPETSIDVSGKVDMSEIRKFVTAVIIAYEKVLPFYCKAYLPWKKCDYLYGKRATEALALALIIDLTQNTELRVDANTILTNFYDGSTIMQVMLRQLIAFVYGYRNPDYVEILIQPTLESLLPIMEDIPYGENYVPILEIPHIIFVRDNLPYGLRDKWRFLFSSKTMGQSFSTMLGKILDCGPTLLIIEDEDQYIFAGYAPVSWVMSPNFIGNPTALLFTLSPHMRYFSTTGYNDHYQYLNLNQQTMPNGLGMGGQFNYWGLWLDCEYGKGQSSESCSTFRNYVQLSKQKDFHIRNVEVWGIGEKPHLDEDTDDAERHDVHTKSKRSVLDKNLEDRVMLELSGCKIHSDGFRE